MFDKVKWHDGQNLSAADFVMQMIMVFDQGKPESPIYDEDVAPNLEAYLSHFKGVQIVSTSPLTIATYDDNFYADAELDASNIGSWWPQYGYGEAPWQSIAIGNMAEANKELAWGTGQADRDKVDWTSFIGGPSLDILSKYLDQAITDKTIPFAPTLGQYITADDAVARYNALKTWYTTHHHFWDGTGPYYLDSVDLNGFTAVV
ncbi:MAG: ABC transporter substrate-binding protein, partial [Chloroflexi bacterium]|nr:ABC transporter substrate-binding protein [Chloroflexota bacterium]